MYSRLHATTLKSGFVVKHGLSYHFDGSKYYRTYVTKKPTMVLTRSAKVPSTEIFESYPRFRLDMQPLLQTFVDEKAIKNHCK